MKIKKLKYGIYLMTACALLLSQPSAYAQNTTTEAQVEFTAGVGPTFPVNPEDPGEEGNTGSVEGSLAIVSVSDFSFGSIAVTTGAGLYDIATVQPNIQVVDLRGTGTGWEVTASVSRFAIGEALTLPGASIHIYKARPNSLSASTAPGQVENLELPTDGTEQTVITAAPGAGTGLWVMRWYPGAEETGAYIKLEVPAGTATVGNHTATINWLLKNAP